MSKKQALVTGAVSLISKKLQAKTLKNIFRSISQFVFLYLFLISISESSAHIITGSFNDLSTDNSQPLVMIGNKDGQSWKFIDSLSGLPRNWYGGQIRRVSCIGNACVAVGSYEYFLADEYIAAFSPLILTSDDGGLSWNFVKNISGIPNNVIDAYLYTVKCQNSICVAGGQANTHNDKENYFLDYPLLLISYDMGHSWSLMNGNNIDLQKMYGHISNITWQNGSWLLTGNYEVFPPDSHYNPVTTAPLFLSSNDNGITWNQLNEVPPLSSLSGENLDASVECIENICLTGGSSDKQKDGIPLILRSTDSGKSWRINNVVSGLPPLTLATKDRGSPILHRFHCSSNICIAVGDWNWGYYTLNPPKIPFMILSRDQGLSWAVVKNIDDVPVSGKFIPIFRAVDCTDNFCIAGGKYTNGNYTKLPFLISSSDKGESWSLVKNISGIPVNFDDADIDRIQCSADACIAIGSWYGLTTDNIYGSWPFIITTNNKGKSWNFIQSINNFPKNTSRAELVDIIEK